MRVLAICLLVLGLLPAPGRADSSEPGPSRTKHPILFYLPNRIFDVLDVVRARVRVGPGVGVSARVTKPVSVTVGFYASLFAGLPGPRGEARIPWPVGVENYAGADVSVFGVSTKGFGPRYGPAEVGAGVQAGIVGADVGIEPLELVDLVLGFFFVDIRNDDF